MSDTPVVTKIKPLSIAIEADMSAAIERAAKIDSKPGARLKRSTMARVLIWEALAARGLVPAQAL